MKRFLILVITACVWLLVVPTLGIADKVKQVKVVNTPSVTIAPGTPVEVTVPVDEPLPVTVAPEIPIPVTASTVYQFAGYSVDKTMPTSGVVLMHRICQESYGPKARMCTTKEFWTSPQIHFPLEGQSAWIQPSIVGYAYVAFLDGRTWVVDFSGAQMDMEETTCGQWSYTRGEGGTVLTGGSNIVRSYNGCDYSLEVTCCTPATP